ncbi:MAG TPA: NIPSNAP family protein [Terriglobia bacterium]|nr:NIPSNAP family protein [Terriglobia bacterium]
MKRRDFVTSSLAASAVAGLTADALGSQAGGAGAGAPPREYYQLLIWHLRRGPQQKLVDDFLRDAALPAMGRIGLGPVGVFNTVIGPGSPRVYVLVPTTSLDVLADLPAHLLADSEFAKTGAAYINAPSSAPAFVRMESFLLHAFEGMPKVEAPPAAAEHRPRIFELRVYESHSKKANLTKIEMFNKAEIAIFRRTGLRPVFFGETLIGSHLPSLTYMLTFDNLEQRDKNWATFGGDPEWKKLSATPGYTDVETVSNINNAILTPAPYSQL